MRTPWGYGLPMPDRAIEVLSQKDRAMCESVFQQFDKQKNGRVPYEHLHDMVLTANRQDEHRLERDELNLRLWEMGLVDGASSDRCFSLEEFLRVMGHCHRVAASRRYEAQKEEDLGEGLSFSWAQRALFNTAVFLAHWLGSARYRYGGGGEMNRISEMREFFNNKSRYLSRMLHGPSRADLARESQERIRRETERAVDENLKLILGRWLVVGDEQTADFVVTIMEGGACLYDGRYMGEYYDIVKSVGETKAKSNLRRYDNWVIDTARSSQKLLAWYYAPDPKQRATWRRLLSWAAMSSVDTFVGHWHAYEDGVRKEEVYISEGGMVVVDGELHGRDLVLAPAAGQERLPTLTFDDLTADLMRTTADVICWTHEGPERISWRRSREDPHNLLNEVDHALSAVDDLVAEKVEGKAYEDEQVEALENFISASRPRFVLCQILLALGLWLAATIKMCLEAGAWTQLASQKAGLDTISKHLVGQTDLRLVDVDCTSLRFQLWRWLAYQFTHVGVNHIGLNCLMTAFLGIPLEAKAGFVRMLLMFNTGVIGGALCYGIWDTRSSVVGMSGGCYALFGVHLAEIMMNWKRMRYAKVKLFVLAFMVAMDNINFYLSGIKDESQGSSGITASNSAHFGGTIAGLVIGVLIGTNVSQESSDIIFRGFAMLFGFALTVFCITWIILHEDPYPVWEWGNNVPTYWYQQVFNLRCLGKAWRCTRCPCSDLVCRQRILTAPRMSPGWNISSVQQQVCPYPWYSFGDRDFVAASASIEFSSVPFTDPSSPCYIAGAR